MIKKISRYTLQQIFIESLEECDSFRIIDGLNPFHIMLNGKELYIYIKNLSPAYFTNPDVWRVQLPKKEELRLLEEMSQGSDSARKKLIEHNLRLVAHIVRKYYISHPTSLLIRVTPRSQSISF